MPAGLVLARRTVLVWLFVAAVAVTAGVGIQQSYRVHDAFRIGDFGPVNDFDRWMLMTPRFLHDRVDYVDDNMPTPPLTLLAFAPFTLLSRQAAQFAWVSLKLPLVCAIFLLTIAIVERTGTRLTAEALLLVVAGWWLPVVVDMQEGQVNFLVLLPLVAALYLAQEESRPSEGAAGFLIGLAAAIKVTPIVFAAYFLWKRRWVVAVAAGVSLLFWLFVVPAAAFGWTQNLRWMREWTAIMIVPYVSRGTVVYASTQSVGSFVSRLLTTAPAFEIHREGIFEYGYMNVAALSAAAAANLARTLMIGVGAAGLVWTRHRLPTLRSRRYVIELGMVAAFMLWFSERTWVHHYVSFVLALAAAGMLLSDPGLQPRARRALERALIAFAAVTLFASEAGRIFGPHGVEWAKACGAFLWPAVLVTATILWAAGIREGVSTVEGTRVLHGR